MEASSPSRSDSFSSRGGGWPRCKPRSLEPLDVVDAAALGESFSSSTTTASFIDMDPEELFSMRWTTSEEDGLFHFGLPRATAAGASACACACSSPLLASAAAGLVIFSDDDSRSLLLPCCGGADDDVAAGGGCSYGGADAASSSACSSPAAAFHTAHSTPRASVISSASASRRRPGGATKPLLATRRILLRYLRFLVPLCRKARALRRLPVPERVFSAPRSCRAAVAGTPARRSTSSASSGSAAEYWCHGNADVDVRDAILHCKKSLLTARTEC